ncbi:hypothetical protein [Bradyrhizobium sp. 174]|uniref:hypothetical protein n=1 Tax=Bradyrhizobium sp. 174 TaxID=2782645 RepID=UPI001FF97471|nr:hypothetical protein [Bradyrhizobium sp. 174]MCK1577815.1 hypothetical protein [Bradyrhizobium sp. 174]
MAEQDNPATLTRYWQPTGRTRIRSGWLGVLVIEVLQERVAMAGKRCERQARWRRAPRGQVVTFGQAGAVRAHAGEIIDTERQYAFTRRG